jgi:hypothetical protein
MPAGASAAAEAVRQRQLVAAHEHAADEARRRANSFGIAGRTELQTSRTLAPLAAMGYHQLADRAWPGTKHANIDLILVGPSGVYVIDTKCWAEVSIRGERLFRGDVDAQDDVDKVLRIADLVEASVAHAGLPPLEVLPVLAFAGRSDINQQLGRAHLQGERALPAFCVRRGVRLSEVQVETVVARLMLDFPPFAVAESSTAGQLDVPAVRRPVVPVPQTPVQESLEGVQDVEAFQQAVLDAALAAPVEDWMTFLHPDQAKVVRRGWSGPARIRGAAGTGKTVLGLHRTAYLTATRPGQVLYVSFVKTLPVVLAALYRRMAPDTADRVEFTGLHKWAVALLRDRGVQYRLDWADTKRAYAYAWSRVGKGSVLSRLDVPWDYWRDEIDYVIKGRGLTSYEQYADLVRVGRGTRLLPEHRRAMWDLFCAYEQQLTDLGAHDFNDVLLMALEEVRRQRPGPYVAVVVDEVQDLNLVGVQLLHALVGDAPDGLLLIGDGQQRVYPGGFTLAEAGISVAGRSVVLRVNYRNTKQILDTAAAVVAKDSYQDLEDLDEVGPRELEIARQGPTPVRVDAPDKTSHDTALLQTIDDTVKILGVSYGDLAVLAATKARVAEYKALLRGAGVPCVDLQSYDGETTDRVKVGTFKRAKGLEFKYVFLPQLADGPSTRWEDETESAHRERVERERRELFVGMTRARDGLWLGFLNPGQRVVEHR